MHYAQSWSVTNYATLGKHFPSLGHSFLIHRVFLGKKMVVVVHSLMKFFKAPFRSPKFILNAKYSLGVNKHECRQSVTKVAWGKSKPSLFV